MVKKTASLDKSNKKAVKVQPAKKSISPSNTKEKTKMPVKEIKNAVLVSKKVLTAEGWKRRMIKERKIERQKKKI